MKKKKKTIIRGEYVFALLFDLSKAPYTINHDLSLKKLKAFPFPPKNNH